MHLDKGDGAAGGNRWRKPVLVVLHQEHSTPGRVGLRLMQRGYPLDLRRPVMGDPLPATLENHSGAIIFGGPMSANDPDEFVRRETDWISVPLAEEKPFVGICLGAQMLVNHLGGTVASHPEGKVEIGWYPLEATEHGRSLMEWPQMIYQFHREGFTLPAGAVHLAQSPDYENQAFRYGENAWAVQFHAELTLAMQHRWSVRGEHRFDMPGAQPARAHLAGRYHHDHAVSDWLDRFLDIVFGEDQSSRPVLSR